MTSFETSNIPSDTELAQTVAKQSNEIVIGTIVSINDHGQPMVEYSLGEDIGPLAALSTISVGAEHIGRQVGLLFVNGQEMTPVLIGFIHNPLHNFLDNLQMGESITKVPKHPAQQKTEQEDEAKEPIAYADGDRIVIEAKEEVVLKCGDASISLNKNGKVSIRGKYLLNRSTGVNRIMGGSVQVN